MGQPLVFPCSPITPLSPVPAKLLRIILSSAAVRISIRPLPSSSKSSSAATPSLSISSMGITTGGNSIITLIVCSGNSWPSSPAAGIINMHEDALRESDALIVMVAIDWAVPVVPAT